MSSASGRFWAGSKEPEVEFPQKVRRPKPKSAPLPKHPETSPDNPFLHRPEVVHDEEDAREREEKAEKRRAKEARSGEAAEARRRRQEEFLREDARRQNAERERQRDKNSKESHRQRTENARERRREKADRNRRQEQKNNSVNTKGDSVEPGARISEAQRQAWTTACDLFFADKEGNTPFPQPPSSKGCRKSKCVRGEVLGVCHHEIGGLLLLDKAHLRKERLRFHPDKFPGGGQNQVKAQEMFQLIQRLIDGNRL